MFNKQHEEKTLILGFILAACAVLVIGFIAYDNKALEVTKFTLYFDGLPDAFAGFKIAQVSDLHNAVFGKGNRKLLSLLTDMAPDIIVITGDLIDSRHTNIDAAYEFCEGVSKIVPTYFAAGNHEGRFKNYTEIAAEISRRGVIVLDDTSAEIVRDGQKITVLGNRDSRCKTKDFDREIKEKVRTDLTPLFAGVSGFKILLAHKPQLIDVYAEFKPDLVLSGHAHGGQFRFPGLGGLYAPHQGLFPVYDAGVYEENGTYMVVSRGLGNSMFPFRFNNRPEVVEVKLKGIKN